MIAGSDVSELLELALLLIAVGAVLVMPTSPLTAPLGVRAAHAMSKRALELAFGAYLLIVGNSSDRRQPVRDQPGVKGRPSSLSWPGLSRPSTSFLTYIQ